MTYLEALKGVNLIGDNGFEWLYAKSGRNSVQLDLHGMKFCLIKAPEKRYLLESNDKLDGYYGLTYISLDNPTCFSVKFTSTKKFSIKELASDDWEIYMYENPNETTAWRHSYLNLRFNYHANNYRQIWK